MPNRSPLLPLVQRFFEHDVAAAARHLEVMDEADALAVVKTLPPTLAAQAVRHLPVGQTARLLGEAPPAVFRDVVQHLAPEQVASILVRLGADARTRLVELLPARHRGRVHELLAYPEDSAGRIMSTAFVAFHPEVKVREAIARLRALAGQGTTSYTYVVDADERLVGVINMRDLILAAGDRALGTVMRRDVFAVDCFADREQVANELARRRFFAVPVVDPEGRLLGVVKSDQLLGTVQEEVTEDMQRMVGAGAEERAFSSITFSLQKRLPWLYVNLATAFLAAAVVGLFESVIARITVLAVFLPVVAGQGGNAGAQSLAVVMRGLVMREIPSGRVGRLLAKETLVGLGNGVLVGVVTAGVAWLWHGSAWLGLVIGIAMVVNMVIAAFCGAAIPLAMRGLGLDPAQSSSIILTTVTDVVGFFAFLGLAVVFESHLA